MTMVGLGPGCPGRLPVATTLNVAVLPTAAIDAAGWVVIVGTDVVCAEAWTGMSTASALRRTAIAGKLRLELMEQVG